MEPDPPSPAAPAAVGDANRPSRRGDRALPLVLLVAAALVGAVLAALGPEKSAKVQHHDAAASWSPSPAVVGRTVSLTIDFGNGAEREFHALPWTEGMTLAELMQRARDFRPGIAFTQQGEGEMAFLTSLEGVANEGADGRYWLYSVDGVHGETSFAVQPITAGAAVLWEFRRGE